MTEKSDENFVIEEPKELKPYYLLMFRYVDGVLNWKHANVLSPKMKQRLKYEADQSGRPGNYEYQLLKAFDPSRMPRAPIGSLFLCSEYKAKDACVSSADRSGRWIFQRILPSRLHKPAQMDRSKPLQ